MKKQYSVVILAAGTSSRMGTPKFLLKYNESTTFLEWIIKEYEAFACEQIVVVLNREGANLFESHYANFTDKLKIIINYHPEWERFYSVKLGLTALGSINPVFIHNVDVVCFCLYLQLWFVETLRALTLLNNHPCKDQHF